MKSILVVDDMAIFREPIAASLRLEGYQTQCAADGEEALRLTRSAHPDLIVLDIAMPGMDGIAFLKQLRSEPDICGTRVILLTVVNDKKRVLAAASLGVKDYILKANFRLADLLERIAKLDTAPTVIAAATATAKTKPAANRPPPFVKAGEIPRISTREEFLNRVKRAFQAKTLCGVVAEVIAMAGSSQGDTAQLATLISRDPMLSARVLQTANSALYASGGAVITTISDAIRKVGFTAVRNIGAAVGVFECMPDASADGFNPIRYWQHSFAVAQLCERLSAKTPEHANLAYVVGLCHDLGEILLHTEFAKEYQLLVQISAETGRPKSQLYPQMFGVTSEQLVAAVLKSMSLPQAIREPIELINATNGPQSKNPLVRCLWMAENYANAAMLASSPSSEIAPLAQTYCRGATGEANPPRFDPQSLRSQVLSMTVALARLPRSDEGKLLAPMFKLQNAKLWIAREPGVSEFDPIGLACESLAQIEISNRLPTDREIEKLDGIAVVTASNSGKGFSAGDVDIVLNNTHETGRDLPILFVTTNDDRATQSNDVITWRTSLSLSDLAAFAQTLGRVSTAASQPSPRAA